MPQLPGSDESAGLRGSVGTTRRVTDLEKEAGDASDSIATNGGIGVQGQFNGSDINEYVNPPADSRLNSILSKLGSPLQQGIIQQTDDAIFAPQKYPYACRFMFNPTTVTVEYSAQEDIYPASALTPAQLAGTAVTPGTTGLSFSLLFDRTYEVAYGARYKGGLARDIGVYRDIAALESVVGARFNFSLRANGVIQPMQLIPCYFIFGGGAGKVGLSFIGAITGMKVTYATFSERMVPMRASVDIGVQQTLGGDLANLRNRGGTILQRQAERRTPGGGRSTRGGVTAA